LFATICASQDLREAAAAHRPELCGHANWREADFALVRLLQARAIENQAYVVGVNRTGGDPYYTYGGRSLIIDPMGEILADADTREGQFKRSSIWLICESTRGLPFLADMRAR
jgi:predicted amidohydrolase